MFNRLTRKYSDFLYQNPRDLLFGDATYKTKLALFTLDPNDCTETAEFSILSLNDFKNIWNQIFQNIVDNETSDQDPVYVDGKNLSELRTQMFR